MQRGPQQRHHGQRDSRLLRPQQQEGIGRVAEREDGDDDQVAPQRGRQRHGGIARHHARGHLTARLADTEDQHQHAGQGRHRGQREHEPQILPPQQEARCDQRSRHGPHVVHRAVEAVGPPQIRRRRDLCQKRVSGRAAEPLADPVRGADREDVPRGRRGRDQRARQRGEAVPGHDQRLAPGQAVGDASGHEPGQARHRLRDSLDDSDERGPRLERTDQERGQQRIDHLAAHVGQEADRPQGLDRPGEGRHYGLAGITMRRLGPACRPPRRRASGARGSRRCPATPRRRRSSGRRRRGTG